MGVPDEFETFSDGAIGFAVGSADENVMGFGVSAGGTDATPYSFQDEQTAKTTLVGGPGLRWVLAMLAGGKDKPVLFTPVHKTTAGTTASPFTLTGTSPAITASVATAYDDFNWLIKITLGGTRGVATFQYSLDGGTNFSQDIVTAATYVVPGTGVTIAMAAGTYVLGDSYVSTSTAPYYTSSDLTAAYDAADTSQSDWELGYVLGQVGGGDDATKAANYVTLMTALSAKLSASESAHRFRCLITEGPDVADTSGGDTALNAAIVAFADPRQEMTAGFVKHTADDGWRYRRAGGWAQIYRLRQLTADVDPAEVALGALPSPFSIAIPGATEHDEAKRQGLPRFGTLRTFTGLTGTYVTNAPLASAPGSDYRWVQHRRLIDMAARITRAKAIALALSAKVRTYSGAPGGPADEDPSRIAGTILEADAVDLEGHLNDELFAKMTLGKMIQWGRCVISRSEIIEQTEDLKYATRIKAFTYPKRLDNNLGFAP